MSSYDRKLPIWIKTLNNLKVFACLSGGFCSIPRQDIAYELDDLLVNMPCYDGPYF